METRIRTRCTKRLRPRGRSALVGIWLVFAAVTTAIAQEPEVLVELSRPKIFEGESVRYSVTLNHFDDTATPEIPRLAGVTVQHVGVTVMRQTIFDGFKRTSIGGPRHEYLLTPKQAGAITIPGPTATLGGKTYRGPEVTLEVTPPNEQDLVVVTLVADPPAVYPMQPFKLTLTIAVKGLPEPFEADEPLLATPSIPVLLLPWADDEQLPAGIATDPPAARWLEAYLVRDRGVAGFGVNNVRLGSNDLFSIFTEQRRARFRPEPRRVKRKDQRGVTVEYWEYTFERSFTAEKIGTAQFGAMTLKGEFAARSRPGGGFDSEVVYAVTPALEVEVRDVPQSGRPDSYIGAIGQFTATAELTPTDVKVGDPMTLTVRVRGEGTLENAFAPRLEADPAIAGRFKVYDPMEELDEGERRFTYRVRPTAAGLTEFPSIELAYFDYHQGRYETLRTDPIPIQVAQADRIAAGDLTLPGKSTAPRRDAVPRVAQEGLFANVTQLDRVRHESASAGRWGAWLLGLLGVFAITRWVVSRRRRGPTDDADRRRLALHWAEGGLDDAESRMMEGRRAETLDALRAALTGFVADALGGGAATMTTQECVDKLSAAKVPATSVERARTLFHALDAARYGDGSHPTSDLLRDARELLQTLVVQFRERKLLP